MKLLLDENLPVKLKNFFPSKFLVSTVSEQGWSGKKNGELLRLMISRDFEALVTIDKNLRYQQNIKNTSILIIILNAPDNKIKTLEPFVSKMGSLSFSVDQKVIEITS